MARFNKYEQIYSEVAIMKSINNYPGVDVGTDPLLTEDFIWHNLQQVHMYCIGPLIDAFGDIAIKSAYRSKALNSQLSPPGVENSQHIKGYAVDFISIGRSTSVLFNWCVNNLPYFTQLIWEYPERGQYSQNNTNSSWIHISYNEYSLPKTLSISSEKDTVHSFYESENTTRSGNFTHDINKPALDAVIE
jgi:hypothetical protein